MRFPESICVAIVADAVKVARLFGHDYGVFVTGLAVLGYNARFAGASPAIRSFIRPRIIGS
ncbi:hypothetical protein MD273_01680 [Marinobacter pelagius]|uniref:hypothetical protein n=1 Tax=Marinobacter sp. C7 TaxID=2951363 RepID=UPI001EF0B523|nr:hypothetical protein [Marinobacter sp. C7]MCG7198426.1 hypothetical protein [Marinobacter sp. C7]